jgi:hypothetical protein
MLPMNDGGSAADHAGGGGLDMVHRAARNTSNLALPCLAGMCACAAGSSTAEPRSRLGIAVHHCSM